MELNRLSNIMGLLPVWELDEFRRIVRNGGLSAMDDERTIELLRQSYGGNFIDPEVEAILPSMDDYFRMCDIGSNILLTGLEIGAGCGALRSGAVLPIDGKTGIQYYSGANGSGKSSYVRVLRAIGRARLKPTLLSNIYSGGVGSSVATAVVNVKGEDFSDSIEWRSDVSNNRLLSSISVFDAECGGIYLESGSVAEAAPSALEVFQSLVEARKRVKDKLQDRFVRNEREIDGLLPPGVYIWTIGSLARKGVKDPFAHITWTQDDDNRLIELRCAKERHEIIMSDINGHLERMSSAKASVAASCKLVVQVNQVMTLLTTATGETVSDAIESLSEAVAERTPSNCNDQVFDRDEARVAVEVIKKIVGRTSYTRRHSHGVESPDDSLITLDHHCVFCGQELSLESLERLSVFWKIINDAAAVIPENKDFSKWQDTIDTAIEHAREIKYHIKNIIMEAPVNGLPEDAMDLLDLLDSYIGSLLSRNYISSNVWEIVRRISELRSSLEARLLRYEKEVNDLQAFSHVERSYFDDSEMNKLAALQWVANNTELAGQIYRLYDENQWISLARGSLGVSEITSLSKKLAAELVGNGLAEYMSHELRKFGLGDILVQISTSSRGGVTALRFTPSTSKKIDVRQVFSEGEKGVMSLALFFAELANSDYSGPIVFDDPCVAMDRTNMGRVIRRMVDIAKSRQVLIFSHNDELCEMTRAACGQENVFFKRRVIGSIDGVVGVVSA